MCGRLACTLNPECLQGACSYLNDDQLWEKPQWIKNKLTYKPFYNGAPTTVLPVLAHKSSFLEYCDSDCSEYVLVPMRWSMSPKWQSNKKSMYHTHNARAETLLSSPLFKDHAIQGRRCVIIADGYYEWQTTQGKVHQPYFLYKEPWAYNESMEWDAFNGWSGKYVIKLAGIFSVVKEDDEYFCTCSVITAESNKSLSWLHHRMPILCDFDYHIQKWITKTCLNADDITPYLSKLCNLENPNQLMFKHHPVNPTYVNNSSYDHPKCMEAIKRLSNSTLDNWFSRSNQQ